MVSFGLPVGFVKDFRRMLWVVRQVCGFVCGKTVLCSVCVRFLLKLFEFVNEMLLSKGCC